MIKWCLLHSWHLIDSSTIGSILIIIVWHIGGLDMTENEWMDVAIKQQLELWFFSLPSQFLPPFKHTVYVSGSVLQRLKNFVLLTQIQYLLQAGGKEELFILTFCTRWGIIFQLLLFVFLNTDELSFSNVEVYYGGNAAFHDFSITFGIQETLLLISLGCRVYLESNLNKDNSAPRPCSVLYCQLY